MEKQYIEFLIHNDAHMQKIDRLQAIYYEIIHEVLDCDRTRENQLLQIIKDIKNIVESNYYCDPVIDVMGTIQKEWDDLMREKPRVPNMIVFAIEDEVEKRHKRKRPYTAMWERLELLGLDKRA